jgi:Signal transduction histidine kinase
MKTTKIIFFFLFTSLVSGWSFQFEEMKTPNSPSSIMFKKVHKALGVGNYSLAEARLDSTLTLATQERDTLNMSAAYEGLIEINFLNNKLLKAKGYAKAAIEMLRHTNDSLRLSLMHTRIGSIKMKSGEFEKARKFLELGEAYAVNEQKTNPFYVNFTEWNRFYKGIGKPDSSMHYLLLLKDKIHPEDTIRLSHTFSELSKVFSLLNNEERALEFSDKALALIDGKKYKLTKVKVETGKAKTLINLHRYKEAEVYLRTDDSIFENPRLVRYKEDKDLLRARIALARFNYEKAEKIISNIDPSEYKEYNVPLIRIFLIQGEIALAKNDLQKVANILEKTKMQLNKFSHLNLSKSYQILASKYYQKTDDYKKSTEALLAKEMIQDSLYNIQRMNLAQNLEAKYKRDQQDQQIATMSIREELNQARLTQQRWLIIAAFFLATVFGGLFLKFSQQNKRIKEQNSFISKSLAEKEVLIKEIHHRVKNNLQVISSLLGLQSRKIKNKLALNAIKEGRTRVQSMSLIHQNLYKENNLTGIEIKNYLEKLCKNLFATYNISKEQINLETNIQNIILDVDSVVPMGLILNELISNSLKHAFPDGRSGVISIKIFEDEDGLSLNVSDNGIGMTSNDPLTSSDSFGFHLIKAFQRKLKADLDISSTKRKGTSISLLIRNYKIAA